MKVLFIGGTGNISTAVSQLAIVQGIDLYLLNRGQRPVTIAGAQSLTADITQPSSVQQVIADHTFDSIVDWIAFKPDDIQRDINLFQDKTKQFIFISSASVYQKPPLHPVVTESTPLYNPHWQYSRDKIACEEHLQAIYQTDRFPFTIVRPSLTYDTMIPMAIGADRGYTIADRMKRCLPVIVPGDGTSLWTVTHAADFAKGFVGLLGHPQSIGHGFHITSDEILTWNQIYQTLADALGVKANLIHIPSDFIAHHNDAIGAGLLGDKAHSVIFDNTKIKMFVPDYCATIPFHQGVRRTLDWYHADPSRQQIDEAFNTEIDRIINVYQKAYMT